MSTNKKGSPCNFTSFYAVNRIVKFVDFMFEIFTEGHVFYDCGALYIRMSLPHISVVSFVQRTYFKTEFKDDDRMKLIVHQSS